jgi:hypothetical protein
VHAHGEGCRGCRQAGATPNAHILTSCERAAAKRVVAGG